MAAYPNGTPSWVELNASDPGAAADFYCGVFGWSTGEPAHAAHLVGGYRMFQQDGVAVAGLMPSSTPDGSSAWLTYIAVDSADDTAAKVAAAGGQTFVDPMNVMDIGRMAAFADPSGATFGVWQAGSFAGAELVNEPVSLCWNDVLTRDMDAVLSFYPAVFDWTPAAPDFEPNGGYTVWQRGDGRAVGGAMAMTNEWFPPQTPAHWTVSFAVADTDAIVTRTTELGGRVTMDAMDCPIGRFAGFLDPQGAAFSVMALAG